MKRTILSLLLLFGLSMVNVQWSMAQAQTDAMYIYRNDGVINAFLKTEIDSIRHSPLDLDSLMHAENVVQEVWTVDSVYRIPLAAIDSISFVTPPTVYKKDVTQLEYNLLDYIIGADGLVLKLKPDTPTMIVPLKGHKLVLLEGCEALPYGFSGIVADVQYGSSSIDVVCEQAYLEDLFDSFCSVSTVFGCNPDSIPSPSSRRRVIHDPDDIVLPLGPYQASCSGEISQGIVPGGDLALSGGASFSVEIQPTFRIHTFLILGEGQGTYFNCSITGSLQVSSQTSLYGGLSFNHDFDRVVRYFPIPQTAGLVNFYINPGVFVRANATITSKATTTHLYTFGMAYDFSSKGLNSVNPSVGGRLASSSVDMEGSLEGSLAGGGYIEAGFSLLCREISRVCLRGEVGYQFGGNFVLRNSDIDGASEETTLYERLKASSVEMGPFVNVGLYASIGNSEASTKWEISHTDLKCDLVPTFSNTKLTHSPGSKTSVDAYTELRGNCLFPVGVGYKLFDDNRMEVGDFDANSRYSTRASKMEHTFSGLKSGVKYKVYPKVILFDNDILANPEAEFSLMKPEIKEFRVTGSHYSQGAYYNDGAAYDYKFDAATTVEIESLEGIDDWGYVYKDPNGRTKRISLMQFGKSYTDTRYAYYRNQAKSTACLYTYVKYEGDSEYYEGEPQEYDLEFSVHTCPDSHHPHAIDLGLPSGTKWCCCNVGASTPEGYGGYYAWGETSEKSYYEVSTYKYAVIDDNNGYWYYNGHHYRCTSIGSDIAGTSYDVARVRMGAPWRMPSHDQLMELMNNCSHQWTQQNGVNGFLMTGPSGGQIFLPAAGCRGGDELRRAGSEGHYWSSWLYSDYGYYALYLPFRSDRWWNWSWGDRYYGLSVRAVRP